MNSTQAIDSHFHLSIVQTAIRQIILPNRLEELDVLGILQNLCTVPDSTRNPPGVIGPCLERLAADAQADMADDQVSRLPVRWRMNDAVICRPKRARNVDLPLNPRRGPFVIMLLRASAIWFLLLGLAIVNGGARALWITPRWGEMIGHWDSTASFCSMILIVTWLFVGWIRPTSTTAAWQVGLYWLALTVAFEFLGGHFLFGSSWESLVADYNLMRGRVWVAVLVKTAVAPVVMFSLRNLRA